MSGNSGGVEPTGNAGVGIGVEGLSVSMARREIPIVLDVDLEIAPGEVLGLVGESGSGKSTVALAMLGHARRGLRVAAGSVRIGTMDVLAQSDSDLRRLRGRDVSYVPQDPSSSLNPAIRVGEQLLEALLVHRDVTPDRAAAEQRIRQILEEVNLATVPSVLRSYPHQLSGGQQQRIVIAMAFACRPRLIVMDEPTTGLDVTTQRHVLDTIRRLTTQYGAAVLYVSHDLPVVGQLAHRTAVMYAGRIVEIAATDELFGSPRHPYTCGLIRAAPSAERSTALVGIPGRPPRPGRWPSGCAFANRCTRATPECETAMPALRSLGGARLVRCLHPLEATEQPSDPPVRFADRAASDASIVVSGLEARYGSKRVLYDVSLRAETGRCLAIVGESGSGKTTLAQCIVGLNPHWTGTVSLEGAPLAPSARKRHDRERRHLQYIFQNPYGSLNPRQSVAENVEEPLRHFERFSADQRRERILDILDTVALGREFADRMPDQLSGGELQRVAIGRALIVDPTVLVCDEITSALDVSVQALIVEQLRDLQIKRGLTMIFITHNLGVVQSIAQDVVVLQRGRVVEQGPISEVLVRPQHPYTRQLLSDVPTMERRSTSVM